jgi:hypothetical protein
MDSLSSVISRTDRFKRERERERESDSDIVR